MKKIRIVEGATVDVLESKANEVLASINSDEAQIKYMLDVNKIVIEFIDHALELKCMDCQFYDVNGDMRGAFGCCQRKGIRVRFSADACDRFEDIRKG